MKIHALNDEIIELDDAEMNNVYTIGYPYGDSIGSDPSLQYIRRNVADSTLNDAAVIHFSQVGDKKLPYVPENLLEYMDRDKFSHVFDTLSNICVPIKYTTLVGRIVKRINYRNYRLDLSGMDTMYDPKLLRKEDMVKVSGATQDERDYTLFHFPLGISSGRNVFTYPRVLPRFIRRYRKKFGKPFTGFIFKVYNSDKSKLLMTMTNDMPMMRSSDLKYMSTYENGVFGGASDIKLYGSGSYTVVIDQNKLPKATEDMVVDVEPYTSHSILFHQALDTLPAVYSVCINRDNEMEQAVNYFDLTINGKDPSSAKYNAVALNGATGYITDIGTITFKRKNPLVNYRCDIYDVYTGKRIPITSTNDVNVDGPDTFTLNMSVLEQIKSWHRTNNTPFTEYETTIDDLVTNTDLLIVFREKK